MSAHHRHHSAPPPAYVVATLYACGAVLAISVTAYFVAGIWHSISTGMF